MLHYIDTFHVWRQYFSFFSLITEISENLLKILAISPRKLHPIQISNKFCMKFVDPLKSIQGLQAKKKKKKNCVQILKLFLMHYINRSSPKLDNRIATIFVMLKMSKLSVRRLRTHSSQEQNPHKWPYCIDLAQAFHVREQLDLLNAEQDIVK